MAINLWQRTVYFKQLEESSLTAKILYPNRVISFNPGMWWLSKTNSTVNQTGHLSRPGPDWGSTAIEEIDLLVKSASMFLYSVMAEVQLRCGKKTQQRVSACVKDSCHSMLWETGPLADDDTCCSGDQQWQTTGTFNLRPDGLWKNPYL